MPYHLIIPTIGQELILASDWTFTLYQEWRNNKFATSLGYTWDAWPAFDTVKRVRVPLTAEVTLRAGDRLKVQRVYIRGTSDEMREFDSLTFSLNSHTKKRGVMRGRFWAKLSDVCKMQILTPDETRDVQLDPVREALVKLQAVTGN